MKQSEYQSPTTTAKRNTLFLALDDPRAQKLKLGITEARQGAEVKIVDVSETASLTMASLNSSQINLQQSGNNPNLNYIDIVNAIVNPGPNDPTGRPNVVDLGSVTNLSAAWSGTNLVFQFDFDPNLSANVTANEFVIHAISSSGTGSLEGYSKLGLFKIDKATTHYTFTFTQAMNIQAMGTLITDFASFCIYPIDSIGANSGQEVCIIPPAYTLDLTTPTINVTSVNNGYSVIYTTPTSASYAGIEIVEYESNSSSEPTGVTYNRVYIGQINPANIITNNFNKRWVKARFASVAGVYTNYSAAQSVTPTSVVNVDFQPPNNVISPSGHWDSDNIVISYTMPSSNMPTRVLVTLEATNNTSAFGYFYSTPSTSSGVQTFTILKKDLFSQFGQYYDQYSAKILGFDTVGNQSSQVSFNIEKRVNPMENVQATGTVTAQPDGYTAVFNFSATAATHAEIYEFYTDTPQSFFTNDLPDFYSGSYYSGGASSSNTLTLTSIVREGYINSFDPTQYIGYTVSGYGVPINTHVVSISGSGPTYNFTLNNSLTDQATGDYQFTGLIYSGQSPANIYSSYYHPRYVIIVWYDDFDNNSIPRAAQSVTPLDPGAISLINNPITFSTNGSILSGDSTTSNPKAIFNKTGLYVYDQNGNQTTQIIGNALNGANTFITTKAQIADWSISNATIQNDSYISGANYTGLSASGNYAFWAGASTSSNLNNDANFSVTPQGAVVAKNISINATGSGTLINAGNVFTVTNSGIVTITGNADITGNINATSGSFAGNLSIGTLGSIYSGTVVPGSGSTPPSLSGQGFILNNEGLKFNNSSVNGITQIDGTTGLFTTKSANIGGWEVDEHTIKKYNSGVGSIILQSGNGTIPTSIYATSSDSTHTAGILGVTSTFDYSTPAIWAGQVQDPTYASLANFYVEYSGKLHARGAAITGTISSSGSLGVITIDGNNDRITFGSGTGASQLFVRDVTGGKATFLTNNNPFSGSTLNTTLLNTSPYIAIGNNTNSFGTVMEGVGLYTTNSYINVTTNNGIGIMTGTPGTTGVTTGMIFNSGKISIGAVYNGSIGVVGSGHTAGTITITNTTVQLIGSDTRSHGGLPGFTSDGGTAYAGESRIVLDSSLGVLITGLPVQADADLNVYYGGSYKNMYPLGPYPRQRMIVEDPVTGTLELGMAVYYSSTTQTPSGPSTGGYVGDLWVVY